MSLHPQARSALALVPRLPLTDGTLARARRRIHDAIEHEVGLALRGPLVQDQEIDGSRVRLYRLPDRRPTGVMIYLHGGGWVLGSIETVDGICRRLSTRSGCTVASIDYPLAPEHPWPAAIEDVERMVAWLRGAPGLGGGRIGIGGDSAGGHLATVVAMRARDRGAPLACQVLIYPALDPSMSSSTYRAMDGYGLTRQEMRYFWNAFLPDGYDRTSPDVVPSLGDLRGMPPTLVITAEYDLLRDEGEAYAQGLADAGVSTVLIRYQGVPHGFFRRLALYDASRVAIDQVAGFVAEVLVG